MSTSAPVAVAPSRARRPDAPGRASTGTCTAGSMRRRGGARGAPGDRVADAELRDHGGSGNAAVATPPISPSAACPLPFGVVEREGHRVAKADDDRPRDRPPASAEPRRVSEPARVVAEAGDVDAWVPPGDEPPFETVVGALSLTSDEAVAILDEGRDLVRSRLDAPQRRMKPRRPADGGALPLPGLDALDAIPDERIPAAMAHVAAIQ